jgi:hypothetical protein
LVAYFGYPEAHDYDAERASRAGLAILDAISKLNEYRKPDNFGRGPSSSSSDWLAEQSAFELSVPVIWRQKRPLPPSFGFSVRAIGATEADRITTGF